MAKNITDIDKEKMYRKIMPSAAKNQEASGEKDLRELSCASAGSTGTPAAPTASSMAQILKRPAVSVPFKDNYETVLVNLMEGLVISRLDATLSRFNCCKCNKCKQDITALALNRMKPWYVVMTENDEEKRKKAEEDFGGDATSALVQAILLVKKTPRH